MRLSPAASRLHRPPRRSRAVTAALAAAGMLAAATLLAPRPADAASPAEIAMRAQEIAQCLPGEIVSWGDGRDRPVSASTLQFVLRTEDTPPAFTPREVLQTVVRAADAWSACGIGVQVSLAAPGSAVPADAVLVQWSEAGSRGNFGLANLMARTLSLGPGAFRLLRERNPGHPAGDTLQMVVSHEMGHFFGLMAHSRRCVDVMSYYDNGKGERCFTRAGRQPDPRVDDRALLPTACDIARCRAVNAPMLMGQAPQR